MNQNGGNEIAGAVLFVACGCLGVMLVIAILFLLTLQKALSRCSPRNRTMEPGMVWLNLIPLVNIVWQFITVSRIAESLRREFRDRGWDRGEDYGYGLGMAYCCIGLVGGFINGVSNVEPRIALLGLPVGLIGIICGIVYWVKIAGYSGQLATRGYAGDDDDDDDDRRDDEWDDREDDRRRDRRDRAGEDDRDDDRDDDADRRGRRPRDRR